SRIGRDIYARTDAVGIDRRPGPLQRFDLVLVQIAAHEDADFFEAGRIQNVANRARLRRQIAAVDAHAAHANAAGAQFARELHDTLRTAARIVGIDEQHEIVRMALR